MSSNAKVSKNTPKNAGGMDAYRVKTNGHSKQKNNNEEKQEQQQPYQHKIVVNAHDLELPPKKMIPFPPDNREDLSEFLSGLNPDQLRIDYMGWAKNKNNNWRTVWLIPTQSDSQYTFIDNEYLYYFFKDINMEQFISNGRCVHPMVNIPELKEKVPMFDPIYGAIFISNGGGPSQGHVNAKSKAKKIHEKYMSELTSTTEEEEGMAEAMVLSMAIKENGVPVDYDEQFHHIDTSLYLPMEDVCRSIFFSGQTNKRAMDFADYIEMKEGKKSELIPLQKIKEEKKQQTKQKEEKEKPADKKQKKLDFEKKDKAKESTSATTTTTTTETKPSAEKEKEIKKEEMPAVTQPAPTPKVVVVKTEPKQVPSDKDEVTTTETTTSSTSSKSKRKPQTDKKAPQKKKTKTSPAPSPTEGVKDDTDYADRMIFNMDLFLLLNEIRMDCYAPHSNIKGLLSNEKKKIFSSLFKELKDHYNGHREENMLNTLFSAIENLNAKEDEKSPKVVGEDEYILKSMSLAFFEVNSPNESKKLVYDKKKNRVTQMTYSRDKKDITIYDMEKKGDIENTYYPHTRYTISISMAFNPSSGSMFTEQDVKKDAFETYNVPLFQDVNSLVKSEFFKANKGAIITLFDQMFPITGFISPMIED